MRRVLASASAAALVGDHLVDGGPASAAARPGAACAGNRAAGDRSALHGSAHFTFPDSVALADDHLVA